ncbi:hypothetical protein Tco_0412198 [Tanacetum coccineum]
MMTAKKRVGPLPTHRLVMRHSVDYSSSGYFTLDDSSRDSPSDSSSEMSSDSSSDVLSDSSSGHSSSNHSSPALPSGMRSSHQLCSSVPSIPHSSAAITERPSHSSSAGPSHKRSRYPTTSVVVSSAIPRALSYVSSDESFESSIPKETGPRVDIDVRGRDEPYSEPDIDPEIQAEIDECVVYADALRAEGIDARVVVETVAREEVETSAKGTVEVSDDRVTHHVVSDDIPEPAQDEGAIEVTYEMLGDLDCSDCQQSAVLSERISELERDNTRLRGTLDVASQRVTRLQRRELRVQREIRQIRRGDEQGGENGDDYEGGNEGGDGNGNGNGGVNGNRNGGGNGNGNGGGNGYENYNMNFGGFMHVARECTYQDFLKCQPLNFKGEEGFVGLTRWFEKMEMVFHISNCPQKYQVKYATCTLLDSALTWWNTHKRTIGTNATYAMTWTKLMKLTTDVMVLDEEDKVERFIGGLPDNIQGNVIATGPTILQDAICIANNLMDQKLKGYARSAENKRTFDNNPRDNREQQPAFKRQNFGGQNVARAYTTGNNEKRGMLDLSPTTTSASCIMKGRVL